MGDNEAVERTLGGDREAFGVLVSQYQAKVYAVALARVYDRQDAQDLCQDAFLRAYLRLPTLRNRDAFAPWLFMILRRLCVDFVRGKWRKECGEQAMKRNQGDAESSTDPQHEVAATDAAETLWAHVGQLDDSSREVLSLHYGQDLKVSEIAALTGVRESAVKMRLQRARSRLGDQVGHLKGAWGIAPVPALSAGIMKAVTSAGPLKGGLMASSPWLGGAAALAGLLWWPAAKDLKDWQGHAPAGMLNQGKWKIALQVLMILVAVFLVPRTPRSVVHNPLFLWVYFSACGFFFLFAFKRQLELLSAREKLQQLANVAFGILMFLSIPLLVRTKSDGLLPVGMILAFQYFFVNKSLIAWSAVLPGLWVPSVLKHDNSPEIRPTPATKQRIKGWLTILHEYGLVAPPCKNDKGSLTVRLRIRARYHPWEVVTWRIDSSLRVNTEGVVSCNISPRDYIVLAQRFGADELPGRQELGMRLSRSFTRAFGIYADGGDRVAVAEALGLAQCPVDVTKTYRFLVLRYGLPAIGIILIAGYALNRIL